jgi:hypothetical protein
MSTREEAQAAHKKLSDSLLRNFNGASRLPVNGVGIGNDGDGYHVQIYLEREPTNKEAERLPRACDGVRVKYQVIGPIVAL